MYNLVSRKKNDKIISKTSKSDPQLKNSRMHSLLDLRRVESTHNQTKEGYSPPHVLSVTSRVVVYKKIRARCQLNELNLKTGPRTTCQPHYVQNTDYSGVEKQQEIQKYNCTNGPHAVNL